MYAMPSVQMVHAAEGRFSAVFGTPPSMALMTIKDQA